MDGLCTSPQRESVSSTKVGVGRGEGGGGGTKGTREQAGAGEKICYFCRKGIKGCTWGATGGGGGPGPLGLVSGDRRIEIGEGSNRWDSMNWVI